jgi:hypothetical protein
MLIIMLAVTEGISKELLSGLPAQCIAYESNDLN